MADEQTKPPAWWTEGYNDDPIGLKIAITHWDTPHTTLTERAAVRAYERGVTYPCTTCGLFAFSSPRTCFWCTDRNAPAAAAPTLAAPRAPEPKRKSEPLVLELL